jgi:arsenite methyltransferase
MRSEDLSLEAVRDYYGRVLSTHADLKTSACCSAEAPSPRLRPLFAKLHPEILERFYGCGSPIPDALEGRTVLDLGCGTGRDAYLCSALVGPTGHVIGVDMTEAQIEVARRHVEHMTAAFGLPAPNVAFRTAFIEDLAAADIADASVDVVISNCVVNLSPDKGRVLSEIFRVLKPGGELYFSDVFSDRRVPAHLHADPVLHGECLAGAMYVEDLRRALRNLGCLDYRVVSRSPIQLHDPEIEAKIGMVGFSSLTVRAFKLPSLEDLCEDYGQVATYRGTIPGAPHRWTLDDHHVFEAGRPMLVCGNTAAMVAETRFAPHFEVRGDRTVHYGPFPCGPAPAAGTSAAACATGACC